MKGVRFCDGNCGPEDGPNCEACHILLSLASSRYGEGDEYDNVKPHIL